jgi:A/G-specific adenine glycosylase
MRSSERITVFRKTVWDYYKEHGRNELPWRKTHDPYKILVSEMMLQQTQVERVKPFYSAFIRKFPTVRALAAPPLADVLTLWQGLGYNSRAKRLHDAAKEIVARYKGVMPEDAAILESLPGIGAYTAHAVSTFAHNHDAIFIETNIRTAVQYHFMPKRELVDDTEIMMILKRALPSGNAREWYSALMDYGAHLKRSGIRINNKSKVYRKQAAFRGSDREARGVLLKALGRNPASVSKLLAVLGDSRKEQMRQQLQKLVKEGLVQKTARNYQLPQ